MTRVEEIFELVEEIRDVAEELLSLSNGTRMADLEDAGLGDAGEWATEVLFVASEILEVGGEDEISLEDADEMGFLDE